MIAKTVTHIPERWDEQGRKLHRHRRRRRLRHLRARGRHHRPDQLVLGRPRRPRRAGRVPGRRHPRLRGRRAVRLPHPAAGAARRSRSGTPICRPTEDFRSQWAARSRTTPSSTTGSRRSGSSSCATSTPAAPHGYDLPPASAACSWPRPACSPRPKAAESRSTRCTAMITTTAIVPLPEAGGALARDRASPAPAPGRNTQARSAAESPSPRPTSSPTPWRERARRAGRHRLGATLAFRQHLFRYGLGVAEAMDTAQRSMGLDWAATQELITRSAAQAREPRGPDRFWRRHRPAARAASRPAVEEVIAGLPRADRRSSRRPDSR